MKMKKEFKMTRLSKVLIGCILFLLIIVGVFVPLKRMYKEIDRRIMVTEAQFVRNQHALSSVQSSQTLFKQYEAISRQVRSDKEEQVTFMKEVEGIVKKNSIAISQIKPIPREEVGAVSRFLLELEFDTTIQDLVSFLYDVADSGTLVSPEEMTIATKDRRANILSVRLVLSKIFLKG